MGFLVFGLSFTVYGYSSSVKPLEAISKMFLNILSCIASAEICEIRGKPFPQIARINAEFIFEMACNKLKTKKSWGKFL